MIVCNLLRAMIRFFKRETDVTTGMIQCLEKTLSDFKYYNNVIKIAMQKIRESAYFMRRKTILRKKMLVRSV